MGKSILKFIFIMQNSHCLTIPYSEHNNFIYFYKTILTFHLQYSNSHSFNTINTINTYPTTASIQKFRAIFQKLQMKIQNMLREQSHRVLSSLPNRVECRTREVSV